MNGPATTGPARTGPATTGPTMTGTSDAPAGAPLRFAFLTTEFPLTKPNGGGLGISIGRITRLLAEAGHQVDIFVPVGPDPSDLPPLMDWHGCRLHHVPLRRHPAARALSLVQRLTGLGHRVKPRYWAAQSRVVARAMERLHAARPFDIVQSADSFAIGQAVRPLPGRLHVVRCCTAVDLYMDCDGQHDRETLARIAMEEAVIRRADLVYAPSALTARHYAAKLARPVSVLPTPVYVEVPAEEDPPPGLPPRYLLHFANEMIPRKGCDLVAEALPLALARAPDLRMVWAGRFEPAYQAALLARLGPAAAAQVTILPRQPKAALYPLIRGATAAVLPSLIDNLPNTVLESLMLDVPVIGSRDSSIEELVEEGVTGTLIPNGSVPALAEAMVRAWTGALALPPGPPWAESRIGRAFRPDQAIGAYLRTIGAAREKAL